jgi:hypothetical protein
MAAFSSLSSASPRKSISEKKVILSGWEQSRLRMSDYCAEQGISIHTLKYWMRQFKMGRKRGIKRSGFVALKVPSSPDIIMVPFFAEVILVSGTRLLIHQQVPSVYLKELLNGSL